MKGRKNLGIRICHLLLVIGLVGLISCQTKEVETEIAEERTLVTRTDTCDLIILYPDFDRIDLVCGTMPSKSDSTVVLCAEACFTGELLNDFDHRNIAGDHVSHGVQYRGYRCKRCTGAFVYLEKDNWKFLYHPDADLRDAIHEAVKYDGAAFTQETAIHEGKIVKGKRKDSNRNVFRALCELDGRLCIIECAQAMEYGDFKNRMLQLGVSEALYLDMGRGWDHAWYRATSDSIVELHPKLHDFCTNWLTFYTH